MTILKLMARATLLAAVVLAATAHVTAPAAAATPCWRQLLNDWYDGRIDKTYPIPCYRETLKHLPKDVDIYSSARDDIQRALAAALQQKTRSGTRGTQTTHDTTRSRRTTTETDTTPRGGSGSPGPGDGNGGTGGTPGGSPAPGNGGAGRQNDQGPFGALADKFNPGSADSLPLPVLILGALALLLVAAGAAGMIVRRTQAGPPRA